MACAECERRRAEMLLMMEAARLWTSSPTGPNVMDIFKRLRDEAISKGELSDGSVRPGS